MLAQGETGRYLGHHTTVRSVAGATQSLPNTQQGAHRLGWRTAQAGASHLRTELGEHWGNGGAHRARDVGDLGGIAVAQIGGGEACRRLGTSPCS
jgi:hypothetical protein